MCYLIAKKFSETGCLALQMTHGQHLADFKERLVQAVGYEDIQLVTISRPSDPLKPLKSGGLNPLILGYS